MSSTKIFPCNTCDLVFENSQAQRKHMREPWHVYNLKRRMAELPPITADTYTEKVATSLVSSKQEALGAASSSTVARTLPEEKRTEESSEIENSISEQDQIICCLFCTQNLDRIETNLEHMSSEHGLYIPEIEHLSSLETSLRYLYTVIAECNECLYCGMVKQSAKGIRRHMLDKGHCMINLEREPELLEFWEFSDSDAHGTDDEDEKSSQSKPPISQPDTTRFKDPSQGQYTLPSGRVVGSKTKAREARLLARRTALAAAKETSSSNQMIAGDVFNKTADTTISSTDPNPEGSLIRSQGGAGRGTQDRAVAVRDAVGLVGVSDQQIRSLITVQRKMQRQQAIVQASAAWADELGGRSQKHYKVKMNLRAG